MRLLIAGGGTGGHIYPALAVARSLRARAGAPELGWLGGHRGLERSIVPGAGIRLHPAPAALPALGGPRRPPRAGPAATRRVRARRPSSCSCSGGRPRSSRPAATSRSRRCSPRPCSGSRACSGRATWSPVVRVRFVASRATVLAVSHAEAAVTLGHPRALRHRDARSASSAGSTSTRPARTSAAGRASGSCSCSADRRPCAGSTTRCSRRLPRLVERVRVVHVTGADGYAAALAAREALPAELRDRYRPYPFLHEDMTARARGRGPRRGTRRRLDARGGRRVRAADRHRPVPARGRPPAPQRGGVRRGRRRDPDRGRGPRRRPAGGGRGPARRPRPPRRDVRRRPRPRPARRRRRRRRARDRGRAARVAPDPGRDRGDARGSRP